MSGMGRGFWGLVKRITMMVEKLILETGGNKVRRGRPRKYEDWEVIFALMVKIRERLSYRKVEWRLRELGERAMDYTTIWYRLKRMGVDGEGREFLIRLIELEVEKVMRILKAKEFWLFIADGTGIGYKDSYKMRWCRGSEIRKVSCHVKVEVLVGRVRGVDMVVGCRVGKAYADENKLLEEIFRGVKYRATYFLGDRYYSKNKVIRMVRERNIVPVIPTENTIRKRVKSEERRWAKKMYEKYRNIYKKRYIVEQVFSVVKRRYDDRVLTKNQGIAELHALAMFALYNLELLFTLYFSPLSHIYLLHLFRTKKINFFNTLNFSESRWKNSCVLDAL